ncbi:MAG: DapH/DapD/GlmU-related protein [Rhodospirillales bacterium]
MPRTVSPSREIAEVAGITGLDFEIHGSTVRPVTHIATLDEACEGSLAFCRKEGNAGFDAVAATAPGGSVIVPKGPNWAALCQDRTIIETQYPRLLFVLLLRALFADELSGAGGIDESAVIHGSASIGANTSIGPLAVIEKNVRIGDGCTIHPGAIVRAGSEIGAGCTIEANTVIGAAGQASELDLEDRHIWMPHLGGVRISPDVRIGANATVVRGTLRDTVIGRGATIGNQANIGHNAHIGEDVFVGVGATIAGSCHLEAGVWVGPGASVLNGVRVGSRAVLAIGCAVIKDVPQGKMAVGNPAKIMAKLGSLNDSRQTGG